MSSTQVEQKKRGRPVGSAFADPFPMRFTVEQLAAIDAWRREQPDLPGRSEAIRQLVAGGLKTGSTLYTAEAGEKVDRSTVEQLKAELRKAKDKVKDVKTDLRIQKEHADLAFKDAYRLNDQLHTAQYIINEQAQETEKLKELGVDAWREAQPDKPSRPEAIRRLVERGMKAG